MLEKPGHRVAGAAACHVSESPAGRLARLVQGGSRDVVVNFERFVRCVARAELVREEVSVAGADLTPLGRAAALPADRAAQRFLWQRERRVL
jgi:hypothetical protein